MSGIEDGRTRPRPGSSVCTSDPGVVTRAGDRRDAGFTLLETLIALTIVLVVMGATLTAMVNATRLSESARLISGVNTNLRAAMDVMVRDLAQAGQGLPGLRRAGVPNQAGQSIKHPFSTPAAPLSFRSGFTLSAFTSGPGLGPIPSGQAGDPASDIVCFLGVDPTFEDVRVTQATAGTDGARVTIEASRPMTRANGGTYNVRAGDLILVRNGGGDILMMVSSAPNGQRLTFSAGDSLNLNRFAAGTGSATDIIRAAPPLANVRVSRVRMITYYLTPRVETDPRTPTLVRKVNDGAPATLAFGIQNLSLTYDLASASERFTGIRMTNADVVVGNGACRVSASENRRCSEDWIRKVNVVLTARSPVRGPGGGFYSSSLFTQIGVRGLSFRDRF